MKKRLLRISLLAGGLAALALGGGRQAGAADYEVQNFPHGIGHDMEHLDMNVPGIYYTVDGSIREYSYDVYRESGGSWTYTFTKINDMDPAPDASNRTNSLAYIRVNDHYYASHYQVHARKLREALKDFSLVTHVNKKGKEIHCRKEYSFKSYSIDSGPGYSLMANDEVYLGSFSVEDNSYAYHFYLPRELNAGTEVAVQAGEGKLEQGGVAYYTEDGYYIRELPVASLVKPGYSVKFLGWYNAREGGSKIQAGTWCASGTTLYARWDVTPIAYDVTCYDICGNSPQGTVLGSHHWKSNFGSAVSGRMQGENRTTGAYYQGYAYQGDTTEVVSTSGAIVYRYFSEHQYQITFDGNGATAGEMASIPNCFYTRKLPLTANCFRREICVTLEGNGENVVCGTEKYYVNRKFLGWSLAPGGQVQYSDGATVSGLTGTEGNVTLYAVWGTEKFTVPEKPQRFGYSFSGWAEDPQAESGGTQFEPAEDITLYAVWKAGTAPYHVEYYRENLEGHYELASRYSYEDYVDKEVEISASDNLFLGFYLDRHSSVLSGKVRPDGSLILSVFYARNVCRVSYDINGGEEVSLPEATEKKYGKEWKVWGETGLKKTGYTFAGWSEEPEGGERIFLPGETVAMPNHNMVLYAVWKPISYRIVLKGNGAEMEGEDSQGLSAAYDEPVKLPVCQGTKTGYEFAGWNTRADGKGTRYSVEETVQRLCENEGESITLYAEWQPLAFEISYDANLGENIQEEVHGTVENTGYSYVEDCYVSKSFYYVPGYRFLGWNTRADGEGKMFAPGENIVGQFTSREENTLYAIWSPEENTVFRVEVVPEGGENPMETLELHGKTGESVAAALKRIYRDTLMGEEVEYFYPGYQVTNSEELEKVIRGDHSTRCRVEVRERTCSLEYSVYLQGVLYPVEREGEYPYRQEVALKDRLNYSGRERSVSRYADSAGNVYQPGEAITLERNVTLIPQFKLSLYGEEDEAATEDYCCWGKAYVLPGLDRPGYALEGWQREDGVRAGAVGEEYYALEDTVLYPVWSQPLWYQITYQGEDRVLQILEDKVTQYQYLTEVRLPGKNQVAVLLDGYEFAGWYREGDDEKEILTKIAPGTWGDLHLQAKLVRKDSSESGRPEDEGQGSDGGGQGDQDSPQVGPDGGNPAGEGNGSGQTSGGAEGAGGAQNPDDAQNPAETPGTDDSQKPQGPAQGENNADVLSQKQKQELSASQEKTGVAAKKGTVFWKNKVRYCITRTGKGKATVKVTGNSYRKKKLKIPSRVSYRGDKYLVTVIGKKAFQGNRYIRCAELPQKVHTVERQAFAGMKRLTKITFGKNLKKLGSKVCYGDSALRRVTVKGKKVKSVGKSPFGKCKRLHKIPRQLKKKK